MKDSRFFFPEYSQPYVNEIPIIIYDFMARHWKRFPEKELFRFKLKPSPYSGIFPNRNLSKFLLYYDEKFIFFLCLKKFFWGVVSI